MRHKNHFKHSLKCLLSESPKPQHPLTSTSEHDELENPSTSDNNPTNLKDAQKETPEFITQLTPNLSLSLSNHLTADFSDKVLDILLDKSKSAFKDTLHQLTTKDPKKFLNLFKSNLSHSIQNENLLNYFNLLIPSISIHTDPQSQFKNLQLDFNLNHDPDSHDNQIGFNLKGHF